MKQIYLSLFFISISNYAAAQYTSIPDPNFEQELINDGIDSEGILDGRILTADAATTQILIITGTFKPNISKIFDLTGIEAFTDLRELRCEGNFLTSLNLSQNLNLEELRCSSNNLNSLDLTNNTQITLLYCNNNALTGLDISNNFLLVALRCFNNSITALDVTNVTGLTELRCQNNDLQPSIDLSQNPSLTTFTSTTNANLLCIQVQDDAGANAGTGLYATWTKDASATYADDCTAFLSIDELALQTAISIYPNPVIDRVHIKTPNSIRISEVILYNLQGKKILDAKETNTINIESLDQGIYLLNLLGEDFSIIKRIIK